MRSWVEISRSAWLQNWGVLSRVVAPAMPMAVIKANAYGHGLLHCAKLAEEAGVTLLGVDSIEEAQQLRGGDQGTYSHPRIYPRRPTSRISEVRKYFDNMLSPRISISHSNNKPKSGDSSAD